MSHSVISHSAGVWLLQLTAGKCLLGQTFLFERRRADVECFNGKLYERAINATPCVCSQEDYEWYVVTGLSYSGPVSRYFS